MFSYLSTVVILDLQSIVEAITDSQVHITKVIFGLPVLHHFDHSNLSETGFVSSTEDLSASSNDRTSFSSSCCQYSRSATKVRPDVDVFMYSTKSWYNFMQYCISAYTGIMSSA